MRYSHTLPVTKTTKRRRGGRPSGGIYCPLGETLACFYAAFVVDRKLAGIVAKLKPLSEQHGIAKFFKNVDHAQVLNSFVQDLAYAVTDYQVCDVDSIVGTV